MFPAFMIAPEVTLTSYWVVSGILTFGLALKQFKKLLIILVSIMILALPSKVSAAMGGPGICGTMCMASWGRPTYPSVYYYPQYWNPYAFYNNPMMYYSMLPPWYYNGGIIPMGRSVQSVDGK